MSSLTLDCPAKNGADGRVSMLGNLGKASSELLTLRCSSTDCALRLFRMAWRSQKEAVEYHQACLPTSPSRQATTRQGTTVKLTKLCLMMEIVELSEMALQVKESRSTSQ